MAAPSSPQWFHLLAGPNGAGKSTLYRALVREGILGPPLEFVNADLYERAHLQHIANAQERSETARSWAEARRATLLAARTSFASETVFSHPSKLALIEEAQRVREGGHPVPAERILARYPRTMAHLAQAVRLADVAYLFDAIEATHGGPRLVAMHTTSTSTALVEDMPAWAQHMLGL